MVKLIMTAQYLLLQTQVLLLLSVVATDTLTPDTTNILIPRRCLLLHFEITLITCLSSLLSNRPQILSGVTVVNLLLLLLIELLLLGLLALLDRYRHLLRLRSRRVYC